MELFKSREIIPNFYQLSWGFTSVFVLVEERVTVVDAGWFGYGRRVLDFLRRRGRSPQDISYLISTHYHPDHIGGMSYLKANSPGQTAAHAEEIAYIQRGPGQKLPNPLHHPTLARLTAPIFSTFDPPPFPVDLPLQDGTMLDSFGGMEVIHSPGHTRGSICLYFPNHGLLIAGDSLQCPGRGPHRNFDLPRAWFTEDMEQAKESIRRLARLDFDVLCLSHFSPWVGGADKALRRFADRLD